MKIRWPDPSVPRPPQTPYEHWLAEGILHLAADCDGAVSEDGVGFNRDDAQDGHRYAREYRWNGGALDAGGWEWCRDALPKYRRQIGDPPR